MIKPSKPKQDEVRKSEIERIIAMNVLAFQGIRKVQRYIKDRMPTVIRLQSAARDRELRSMVRYIEGVYGVVFKDIVSGIKASRIASAVEQHYLAEQTLGQRLTWRSVRPDLPQTEDFRVTNKILSERSILRRNKEAAERVSLIIKKELDRGSSIPAIQKKVDIELGLRDKQGNTNAKQLKLLKEGKFAHANGHFYQTYRIARTESMRMAAIQTHDTLRQLQRKGYHTRLELIATVDSRSREQSIAMNGQISDAGGRFLYPDGNRYKLGRAPARWSINDRETSVPVFPDIDERPKPIHASLVSYKRSVDA